MKIISKKFKKKEPLLHQGRLAKLISDSEQIGKNSLEEAEKTDSLTSFPEKTLVMLRSSNLLTATIPKKYGGVDLGLLPGTNLALLIILKNIGRGNLVVGRILEGHLNAQMLIDKFGNKEHKKRFARDALDGRLFGVWNTQASDGTYYSDGEKGYYNLSGSKTFATGTDYVTRPIVTASKKDGSWQMFVVALDQVKVRSDSSWWNPLGMKSSRSFKMTFLKSKIKKVDALGAAGEYYQQPGFSGGTVRFAAVQLGAAEQLLEETKKYLVSLGRMEDPYQKMRLGQMAIAVESGNQWLVSTAVQMDLYMKTPTIIEADNFIIYANMMRTAIEEICTDIMNLCQKCIGARGLNKPYHFERIIRDLNTYLRQPSPDGALADVGEHILNSTKYTGNIWNLKFSKNSK